MERTPNSDQQLVINDLDNNIILFASAGTGKTFSVANRIKNIIEKKRATPEEILCVTFTVKACREMAEDISFYVGELAKGITIKTIHSFCLYLNQVEAKKNRDKYVSIDVCDEVDQQEILTRLLDTKGKTWILERFLKENTAFTSVEQLFENDVVVLPRFQSLFWIIEHAGEKALLSSNAFFAGYEENRHAFENARYKCPVCGAVHIGQHNECENCGFDFRRFLGSYNTGLISKAPRKLAEIVSAIKYCRFENDFYSEDSASDFEKTIELMLSKQDGNLLFSYYDPEERQNVVDEKLLLFFRTYGGRYMEEYASFLKQSNYMDYDDLIIEAARSLCNQETKAYWQGRYKYITIDEMQDTNITEYRVLSSLFEGNNAMMCGDFFQTIYEWRGSQPDVILGNYIKGYHAKTYMFRENYRATTTLARASFGYLQDVYPDLIGKYCPAELEIHSAEIGEKIQHYCFNSSWDEAAFIYNYLVENSPQDPTSVCVMSRSNKYICQLADSFDRMNNQNGSKSLSFFTVERNAAFYKTASVKDLLAFMRILLSSTDDISMERIAVSFINRVGRRTVDQLKLCGEIGVSLSSFLSSDTYQYGDCYGSLINAKEESRIVVYDTETTGLDLSKDQIIQIAAVRYNARGEIEATFNEVVIPTVEISQGAKSTIPYNVDKAIQEHGIPAVNALASFSAFVQGSVLVGHNSSRFDSPLLQRQLCDLGLPPLEIQSEFDTLSIAKQFYPRFENYKLATLCNKFVIVNQEAHNALGDVLATGEVLFHMLSEKVIPTHSQRIQLLGKHVSKFEGFYSFKKQLEQYVANNDVPGLVDCIISTCRLETIRKTASSQRAIHDVRRLVSGLQITDARSFLQEFITNASLSGSQMDSLLRKLNQIPIITVHQSKGCEFDTVILAGCDNFNFPSFAAVQNGQESEEKRVFYVAISRAKKKLLLTNYTSPGKHPRLSSDYLSLIPREYVDEMKN